MLTNCEPKHCLTVTAPAGGMGLPLLKIIFKSSTYVICFFLSDWWAEPRSSHSHRADTDQQVGDHRTETHAPGPGDWAPVTAEHGTELSRALLERSPSSLPVLPPLSFPLCGTHLYDNLFSCLPALESWTGSQPAGHGRPVLRTAVTNPEPHHQRWGAAEWNPLWHGASEPGVQNAHGHQEPPGAGNRHVPPAAGDPGLPVRYHLQILWWLDKVNNTTRCKAVICGC